jgi:hypothetical protein
MQAVAAFLGQFDADSDRIRERCLAIAQQRFGWHHAIEEIQGLYCQLLT